MVLWRSLLLLLCSFGMIHAAGAQASDPWVEKALAFAEDIEPDLFSEDGDTQDLLGHDLASRPVEAQITAHQDLAFMYAMALNVEQSKQTFEGYKDLFDEFGTKHHQTVQRAIEISNSLSETGDYAATEQSLTRLAETAVNHPPSAMLVHIALAYIQYDNGSVSSALRSMQRARQLSHAFEQSPIIALELEKLSAYLSLQSGAQEAVIDAYRRSWTINKAHGFSYESSETLSNIAWMLRQSGEIDASKAINQKVLAALDDDVAPRHRFFAYVDCGAIELDAKNYAQALKCLEQAEPYLTAIPERRTSWEILYIRALARTGQADKAKAKFEAFIADPKTQGSGYAAARLPFLESEILFATGKADLAYDQLVTIRETERIKNAKDGHASSLELRNLLEQETDYAVEQANLKESLLTRQRYITVLTVILSIALIGFCFYLLLNRRREQKLAVTDTLTKVLNRRGFWLAFEQEVERGPAEGTVKAIGVIDLDGFKSINDVYGHSAGDRVLVEIATRLRDILGEDAIIGRLGGDEFAFLLTEEARAGSIQARGDAICGHLRQPLDYEGATIKPGASIGLSIFSDGDESPQDLYDYADYALYFKKRTEPGSAQVFDLAQRAKLARSRDIETALFAADEDEFYVVYQPIVDGRTGEVKSFEALARWSSATLGDIPPETFIPIAERTSRVRGLSKFVTRSALRDAQTWPSHIGVSINLSSQDVASVFAVQSIADEVKASGIDPARLTFELTETAIIHDNDETRAALQLLSDLGVNIALDDFGTGYSSINHLHTFPINKIKIDQGVTRLLGRGTETSSIIKLALNLCDILDVECIVEGVEKPRQRSILVELGAQSLQGFLFAKPMIAEDIGTYLTTPRLGVIKSAQNTRDAG